MNYRRISKKYMLSKVYDGETYQYQSKPRLLPREIYSQKVLLSMHNIQDVVLSDYTRYFESGNHSLPDIMRRAAYTDEKSLSECVYSLANKQFLWIYKGISMVVEWMIR